MKNRFLLLVALVFSIVALGQKKELKSVEKALKGGNTAEAKSTLDGIQGMIAGASEKEQAQYYFLRGKTYADLAKKGDDAAFTEAATSFKKVLEIGGDKGKYAGETKQRIQALTADLVNSAVDDNAKKEYEKAADKLYAAYTISPQDTSYLYFAAGSAVTGNLLDKALGYYEQLQKMDYDGSTTVYKATNVDTGNVEEMNKAQRDLMVKSGTYTNPVDEQTPSRKAEIVKNIALIYTQLGDNEKAVAAYQTARASNPEDVNLVLNEANLYYQMGDKTKFKELMSQASKMAPNNPDLHYNIGVINMEQGNREEARAAYKKTIEVDPSYTNAYLNLSTTYVNEGNELIDEMNALGMSKADVAKYDELKAKKDSLFKDGAQILENGLKTNPGNQAILTQLKNIYGALGDNDNFMRVKKLLGE